MSIVLTLLDGVRWHGEPVVGERPQALLAALATPSGTAVRAERLVDAVWADDGPANPGKALQVLVSRTRSVCGPNSVVRDGDGYRLGLRPHQIDALVVRSEAAAARGALTRDPTQAAEHARAALALAGGLTIAEDASGPLADVRREAVRDLRSARTVLAQAESRSGSHDEALPILEEAVAAWPDDEALLADLLRSLAAVRGGAAALSRFESYRSALRDRLGTDPGSELQRLHHELLSRDSPVRDGLHYEATALVGRADDIRRLRAALVSSRVVSILGAGGLGKTRLAHVLGRNAAQPVAHFVELVGVTAAEDLVGEVGTALGVRDSVSGRRALTPEQRADVRARIAQHLDQAPSLLILDNCEHIVDAVADLVAYLVATTRELRVLTTTRAPLAIAAERVYLLGSLGAEDAGELFAQRALAARPDVVLDEGTVADIVRQLDGLPLGIELAAAKVRVMSTPDIARRLQNRFALLRGGDRSAPDRHQTLLAVIDWSWNLLTDAEQRALRWVSVFHDGFTLDAAERVLGPDALDAVQSLVSQSLLTVLESGAGVRYRMLETVREFGRMQLVDVGEDEAALAAHRDWAVEYAVRHVPGLFGPGQFEAVGVRRDLLPRHRRHRPVVGEAVGISKQPDGVRRRERFPEQTPGAQREQHHAGDRIVQPFVPGGERPPQPVQARPEQRGCVVVVLRPREARMCGQGDGLTDEQPRLEARRGHPRKPQPAHPLGGSPVERQAGVVVTGGQGELGPPAASSVRRAVKDARGLSWERLKGADAWRAALLRAAAGQTGCESVLALAEVKETWEAYPEGDDPWDDYGYGEDDEDEDGDAGADGDYVLQELVDDEITLGWWTGPDGTGGEPISLRVHDYEVCASTASTDLTPYDSQYEGYMGNYGNTLDRWYRRAAVVVWPRERAFAARGEAGSRWALEELRAAIARGDLDRARNQAQSLAPFWKHTRPQPELLECALQVAAGLDAAETAAMLLEPFQAGVLSPEHAGGLAAAAERYGTGWMRRVVDAWFASEHRLPSQQYQWTERLPELCAALRTHRAPAVAQLLSAGVWAAVDSGLRLWTTTGPAETRRAQLQQLALPLRQVVVAADEELRDGILATLRERGDTVLECLMPLLRRAAEALPAAEWGMAGLDGIARDCADRLREACERSARAADDWSVAWIGCGCELCGVLGAFLGSRRRVIEWPLAKEGRRHVHTRIDSAELPVRHQTRRQGRPYTLVLTKTQELFTREQTVRSQAAADLAWLMSLRNR
ncbi:BTAD domain-containing putative transcriptional regulator [Streptomyces dysideae]|uniref:OmpR/PhoB-type domain-containing protein n=1 Tax=Streptomyces dysideae TaxID=909626 RepID=A0A101UTZ4_9ACTN|nr:BTAD domain-containing putative transcriptional regulator [Streptomyces dysideae]KUO16740.1 hypothetical protein AQJ91_33755 [Streptomyces dysideae]